MSGYRRFVGSGADSNNEVQHGARDRRIEAGAGLMTRPVWSGSISFGLVSVPVKAYTAKKPAGKSA